MSLTAIQYEYNHSTDIVTGFQRQPEIPWRTRASGLAYNGHFGCTCYHRGYSWRKLQYLG